MMDQDKQQSLGQEKIERVFDSHFENNSGGKNQPYQLPKNEFQAIVKKIERLGGRYVPDSGLSLHDQLLACEAIAEATPINQNHSPFVKEKLNEEETEDESLLDGIKQPVNVVAIGEVIEELKEYNTKTPPKRIENLFFRLFGPGLSKNQWLWIARLYTPRQVIWELKHLKKRLTDDIKEGWVPIDKPAAYFTYRIKKFRKKRKHFRK